MSLVVINNEMSERNFGLVFESLADVLKFFEFIRKISNSFDFVDDHLCIVIFFGKLEVSFMVYLYTYTYLHLPTPTYTYLSLPTLTYIYLHLPTPIFTYLHPMVGGGVYRETHSMSKPTKYCQTLVLTSENIL